MSLRLNGSTSGYVEIDAPAVAGNNTLRLPTTNGTDGSVLQVDSTGQLAWRDGNSLGTGTKNRIINGDMRIDQRNAGAAVNSAPDGTWAVDRWICYHNIATVNVGQNLNSVASINGTPNQLGIQITATATATGSQYTNLQHYIEGFNSADLAWGTSSAQSITISFWVRSSVTGTHGAALQNAASALGYPFSYSISAANTWEYKTITIPGPTTGTWNTTNGRGIVLIFDLGQGPNFRFAAGSWQAGNVQGTTGAVSLNQTLNATWYITGVQLEAGSVATPFERRSFGQELMLCQRYFESSYPTGYGPGFNFGEQYPFATSKPIGLNFVASDDTTVALSLRFAVSKRTSPTVTIYSANNGVTGNTWTYRGTGGTNLNVAISVSWASQDLFGMTQLLGAVNQANESYLHFSASAEL